MTSDPKPTHVKFLKPNRHYKPGDVAPIKAYVRTTLPLLLRAKIVELIQPEETKPKPKRRTKKAAKTATITPPENAAAEPAESEGD